MQFKAELTLCHRYFLDEVELPVSRRFVKVYVSPTHRRHRNEILKRCPCLLTEPHQRFFFGQPPEFQPFAYLFCDFRFLQVFAAYRIGCLFGIARPLSGCGSVEIPQILVYELFLLGCKFLFCLICHVYRLFLCGPWLYDLPALQTGPPPCPYLAAHEALDLYERAVYLKEDITAAAWADTIGLAKHEAEVDFV
jgi:hypothetical protein